MPSRAALLRRIGGNAPGGPEAVEPRGSAQGIPAGNAPSPERVWLPASLGTADADRRL